MTATEAASNRCVPPFQGFSILIDWLLGAALWAITLRPFRDLDASLRIGRVFGDEIEVVGR